MNLQAIPMRAADANARSLLRLEQWLGAKEMDTKGSDGNPYYMGEAEEVYP